MHFQRIQDCVNPVNHAVCQGRRQEPGQRDSFILNDTHKKTHHVPGVGLVVSFNLGWKYFFLIK